MAATTSYRFQVEDAEGHWQIVSPVLDTVIHLAARERTVGDTLDEILAQLSDSPGNVGWGFVPLNLFNQTRIRMVAEGVPAREVMRSILEELPQRITWRLNYEPMSKRYLLSFLVLADANENKPSH